MTKALKEWLLKTIGRGGKVLCYSTSACFWKTGHPIGQKVRFLEFFNKNKNIVNLKWFCSNHNFWLELKNNLIF